MNEQEAKDLLNALILVVQKARSNVAEAVCGREEPSGVSLTILQSTNPLLFPEEGKIGLLTTLLKATASGRQLAPIELYNVLFLVHQSPATILMARARGVDLPLVHPLPSWLGGWEEEDE